MRHVRANDRWPMGVGATGRPELGPLLGPWYNCNARTGEIVRLELSEDAGGLKLQAFGADEAGPIDWGETPAEPHVEALGSRVVTGFTARYDFSFMETQVAANVKYGVLVIQSYNRFRDDSGRPCYFTREFFHQRLGDPPAAAAPGEGDLPFRMLADRPPAPPVGAGLAPGRVDLSPLLGRWRNTYTNSRGVTAVELTRGGDGFEIEAFGLGYGPSWGKAPAVALAPNVASGAPAGFVARFDFGFSDVLFSANEAKGLLIIASSSTFRDGSGRSGYFTREFFYRERPIAEAGGSS